MCVSILENFVKPVDEFFVFLTSMAIIISYIEMNTQVSCWEFMDLECWVSFNLIRINLISDIKYICLKKWHFPYLKKSFWIL